MNTPNKVRSVLLAGALMVLAVPAFAADENLLPLPQPVHEGNVTYISGGIGADEEAALKSEAKDYNLLISNADKDGNFTLSDNVVIKAHNGHELVKAENVGPLFYAKLPPGAYTVTATNGDQREVRNVKISANKEDSLHLIWGQT
jgi:hypothetical protein